MAVLAPSPTSLEEMKKLLWAKVDELKKERERAWAEHKEFLQEHPPRFDCDGGSEACALIANQIESVIEVGKLLSLVDENVEAMDYY